MTRLPAKDGEDDLIYYVTESKVDGYRDPMYGFKQKVNQSDQEVEVITAKTGSTDDDKCAYDGQYVINKQEGSFELPSTGGPGIRLFEILGSIRSE